MLSDLPWNAANTETVVSVTFLDNAPIFFFYSCKEVEGGYVTYLNVEVLILEKHKYGTWEC